MFFRFIALAALLAGFQAPTWAEPSSHVAWTPQTLAFVRNGNAEHGHQLAGQCEGCHAGDMPEAPYLNGQLANYLFRQLKDYQDGSRSNDIMSAVAGTLKEQDMADIAAWYASQKPPAWNAKGSDAARKLVAEGDSQRMLAACSACHSRNGQGQAQDIPRLAGQKPAYLAATLSAYKSGERHNDVYQRMRLLATSLKPDEIRQLADYYADNAK